MTKRMFIIVIHLYKMQFELDIIIESGFIFILQISLLSFFFFFAEIFLLGSKISKE